MPSFEQFLVDRRAHVRAAATAQPSGDGTAARPGPAWHPLVMPLTLVVVDEAPVDSDGIWRDDWHSLPEPFASALQTLIETPPGDGSRCWLCGSSAVGWTEELGEAAWGWQLTGLLWSPVMSDDPVNVYCEGCTPLLLEQPTPDDTEERGTPA